MINLQHFVQRMKSRRTTEEKGCRTGGGGLVGKDWDILRGVERGPYLRGGGGGGGGGGEDAGRKKVACVCALGVRLI